MAAKKKAAKRKPVVIKEVSFQAFGNQEIRVALNAKNRTLGGFIKQNVPPAWNLDQFALRVNDREVGMDYMLNDGDSISAAPNVAGGTL
jgi:molybdopterin converting factor small subunit